MALVDRAYLARGYMHALHQAEHTQQVLLGMMSVFDLDRIGIVVVEMDNQLAVGGEEVGKDHSISCVMYCMRCAATAQASHSHRSVI